MKPADTFVSQHISLISRPAPRAVLPYAAMRPAHLNALIAYLRPLHRGRLLPRVADLGIFINEREGLPNRVETIGHDLVILATDSAGVRCATELALGVCVLALVPDERDLAAFAAAGIVCMLDDELETRLAEVLGAVARSARERRVAPAQHPDMSLRGDVRYSMRSQELITVRDRIALSGAESTVLLRLSRAPGRPVALADVEGEVGWQPAASPARELRSVVVRIRRKIEQLGGDPLQIATVLGFGYVLIP